MTTTGDEVSLERVAEIARSLAGAAGLDEVLQRVADLGAQHLERCDGVSVMLVQRGGRLATPAYSTTVARDSDRAQYDTGEGPCLTSMDTQRTIVIDDLEQEDRWPRFREQALALGIRSMASFRLFLEGDTMGALNFHASTAHAFGHHDLLLGEVFASHAAVALRAAITEAGLEAALESRDRIGQAKGVIMNREGASPQQAFDRLRALSERQNRPLRDVADQIARTGEIPVLEPTRKQRRGT
ncbi:GAF and ANTAR domain-containing protein [Nitriliruptor alkaliphilus]|uniref:GAF and ANTAR domain-containing protein n=1 Tax=Nitriliruptor alkaliphilus TaxID=427918 RepID=UPI000697E006|nr:GAF and ANTAR domain-containing protein [Nitriliruptor alkaliphilus]